MGVERRGSGWDIGVTRAEKRIEEGEREREAAPVECVMVAT
jgi:hypothetical protein